MAMEGCIKCPYNVAIFDCLLCKYDLKLKVHNKNITCPMKRKTTE